MSRPVEAARGEHLLGIDAGRVTTVVVVAAPPSPVGGLWPPALPMNQHTILLLAANPEAMPRLNVDDEARDIRIALQQKGHGDAFKLEVWPAARPGDLLDGLGTLAPTVVHFSGHGGRRESQRPAGARRDISEPTSGGHGAMEAHDAERHGLFFQGPDGQPQFVSAAALKEAFAAAGSSVKLVVLNACYSELLADALLPHVGCVVGVAGAIGDASARQFSVGFYGGLGQCRSVDQAFAQGGAAVRLEDLPDHDRPQLRVRADVDAKQLVVAAMPSATPSRHAFERTPPTTIRGEAPTGAPPLPPSPTQDRGTIHELLSRLSKLLSSQFEQVLYLARIPQEHLPAAAAPQASRAVELMRYVEQQNQLEQLARIVQQVVTGGGPASSVTPSTSQAQAQVELIDTAERERHLRPARPTNRRRLAAPQLRSHIVIDEMQLAKLTSHVSARRWIGIFGLSGSGKSTLAAYIAKRCADTMDIVWLSVGDQDVGFLLEALAVALGESLSGIAGFENQASCLRAATASDDRLFIFDDVSHEVTAEILLQSVAANNSVIVTSLDAGLFAWTQYELVRMESTPLTLEQSRQVAARLLRGEWTTGHHPDHEKTAVETVARLATGQPAVIEALVGELRTTGLDAAPELELTMGGIASQSVSERLRMLGARTLGSISDDARRIVRALHVFSSNSILIDSLADVTGCNVAIGLRDLQRRMIVTRTGHNVTFHDYVRRLSQEVCDDAQHDTLMHIHVSCYLKLIKQYGGWEWNLRGYPSLVAHENELIPLLWRALGWWDARADGVAVVLKLATGLSWYLHWRGYNETRFRMCDEIIQRVRGSRRLAQFASLSNSIGNLHVDQGWVLLARGQHSEARRLAIEAQAWIDEQDRIYAEELDAQAALADGDARYAIERFTSLTEQVREPTRSWCVFAMQLANAYLAAGELVDHERLLARLLIASERPLLASGEMIEDVRARILMRCAARDFTRNDHQIGLKRLSLAVDLFEKSGCVISDRVHAMLSLATRVESTADRTALLKDALRHARTLGGRTLIFEVEQALSTSDGLGG